MNCKQGSYLEFTIPYVIDDSGYVTKINGQLMHVDMSTSLKFRSLLECETLEVCSFIMGFNSFLSTYQFIVCQL